MQHIYTEKDWEFYLFDIYNIYIYIYIYIYQKGRIPSLSLYLFHVLQTGASAGKMEPEMMSRTLYLPGSAKEIIQAHRKSQLYFRHIFQVSLVCMLCTFKMPSCFLCY
jgi:hypothetical protein